MSGSGCQCRAAKCRTCQAIEAQILHHAWCQVRARHDEASGPSSSGYSGLALRRKDSGHGGGIRENPSPAWQSTSEAS